MITYTLQEVVNRSGLSEHTLRYYEQIGLLDYRHADITVAVCCHGVAHNLLPRTQAAKHLLGAVTVDCAGVHFSAAELVSVAFYEDPVAIL